jgi:hypothetical protein
MVPFFAKKIHCKHAKYASTRVLGEFTRDASGQSAKKRKSGIAHASSRIRSFPLAALPTGYSRKQNLPDQNLPKKVGEIEQHSYRNRQQVLKIYKHSKCFKQQMFTT